MTSQLRPFAAIALALAAACTPTTPGETKISQEARDAYQDKRLDAIETRIDQLEAAARRQAAVPRAAETAPEPEAPSPVRAAPTAAPAPTAEALAVELVDVSARSGEANSSWTKFAWKATLKSNLGRQLRFTLVIKFADADGYVLDDTSEAIVLGPFEERTFTGTELIDASVVSRVANVTGELRM